MQWLRDGLGIIKHGRRDRRRWPTRPIPTQEVYLVPAFVGLGAPYWDADARGAMFGLTRDTGPAELARAALEASATRPATCWTPCARDWPDAARETVLRVDGGMVASDWTMQRLADILDAPVDRPKVLETTALGAAYLAGLQAGVYPEPERASPRPGRSTAASSRPWRPIFAQRKYAGGPLTAVSCTLTDSGA